MICYKKHVKTITILFFLTALIFFPAGRAAAEGNPGDSLSYSKQLINEFYLEDIPDSVMNSAGDVQSLVKLLNDPYSAYFTEQQYNEFMNDINNSFSGIGIQIDKSQEGIKIISVFDNTPASLAGVKPGDIILKVENNDLSQASTEEAVKYIKGNSGTLVNLEIKRGDSLLKFTIERKAIEFPTVESSILDNHIGYISITSFGENTANEFGAALKKLNTSNPDSYIVDIRNNGGGYMNSATDIAGYFIGENVVLKGYKKSGDGYIYTSPNQGILIDKPTIFLINKYSASASEILAAALKDYKKAFFIGENTYGKGVAQNVFLLPDNSYIKLTVLKFVSPLGHEISKVGIVPDMEVKDSTADNIDSLSAARILLSKSLGGSSEATLKTAGQSFEINMDFAKNNNNLNTYTYITSNNNISVEMLPVQDNKSTNTEQNFDNNSNSKASVSTLPQTGSMWDFQTLIILGSVLVISGLGIKKIKTC
ncbi:MAG: S41 family peptidase [Solirubrobacterales bacterium]